MNLAKQVVFVALAGALSGCGSTMLENGQQEIALALMPAMATCEAYQAGELVGRYDATRNAIVVPASLDRTEINCFAPGYKDKHVSIARGDEATGYRRYLIDFGVVPSLDYPGALEITLEPADRQGKPS